MSKPQANWKVNVDDEDFPAAQNLMVGWEATDPGIASAHSLSAVRLGAHQYPQMTRKFLTPALAGAFLLR